MANAFMVATMPVGRNSLETARNEYNVDMPAQEPGEPFVIKLQIKEAAGVVDKYRDALT